MKQFKLVFTLALLTSFIFTSCKKASTTTNTSGSSTWTFDGTNYTGVHTLTGTESNGSGGEWFFINSDAQNGNLALSVTFNQQPAAGTYTVIDNTSFVSSIGNTECFILYGSTSFQYESNGAAGNKVVVTKNGSKITATFSNISLQEFGTSAIKPISGTLVEQ